PASTRVDPHLGGWGDDPAITQVASRRKAHYRSQCSDRRASDRLSPDRAPQFRTGARLLEKERRCDSLDLHEGDERHNALSFDAATVSSNAMTAILLLVLLLAGTSAYIKWAAYWVEQGASAWWFVAGAPFAYLAPVVVLVTSWFVLSWIWRTPRPPGARLDLAGSVRLFIG